MGRDIVFHPLKEQVALSSVIGSFQPCILPDYWICCITPYGMYTVEALCQRIDHIPILSSGNKFIWTKEVPIKVSCFVWRARTLCIPSTVALQHRAFNTPNSIYSSFIPQYPKLYLLIIYSSNDAPISCSSVWKLNNDSKIAYNKAVLLHFFLTKMVVLEHRTLPRFHSYCQDFKRFHHSICNNRTHCIVKDQVLKLCTKIGCSMPKPSVDLNCIFQFILVSTHQISLIGIMFVNLFQVKCKEKEVHQGVNEGKQACRSWIIISVGSSRSSGFS
ncbi:unnamed protein product [Lactuca virosa]|uniref:Reverse transcriptase zinc-binding domain-containing protein n=1 Tax=Lactuca virosa TaxID=75947 RepID=A0AAU9LNR9_9ASTR|nr:unnamed protein product [Lactuca virosa]